MSTTFSIRAATLDDLTQVDALLGRSYPALLKHAYPPSLLVTAIPLISKAQPRLLSSGTYFVVTDGDTVVGAGGWTQSLPGGGGRGTPRVGNIRHVVTDHRRVRQGIGKLLMAQIFNSAKHHGVVQLECMSTLMAEPFYAAVGFETVGPINISLRPGVDFPTVHMQRRL